MSTSIQKLISKLTAEQAEGVLTAYNNIPEDKRDWNPENKGRSAIDQLAEMAIINFNAASSLVTHLCPSDLAYQEFQQRKVALSANPDETLSYFRQSVTKVTAAIDAVKDECLEEVVLYPWGSMTIAEVLSYPLYNMSYHEGQINYIASLLGRL